MKFPHLRSLFVLVAASFVAGCVPYQQYEDLAFEHDKAMTALNDLRSKYALVLTKLKIPSDGTIEALQTVLDEKVRLIADLENEIKRLGFEKTDPKITNVELGPEGQLVLQDILFRSGSDAIGPSGRSTLDEVAQLLKSKYPGERFHLVGHTDNVPIQRSGHEYNLNLGLKRAIMVFRYLNREHGFPESQFSVASYGETRPRVPNDSPENRSKNRRVELFRVGERF